MTSLSSPIIFFPGAGGEIPNLSCLIVANGDSLRFETLTYPSWPVYASKEFTIETLIAEFQAQIATKVPQGPIRIIGYSIGGHFGYVTAIRLQAIGREVAGFCAIDSFMIESLEPSADWKSRALSEAFGILRKGNLVEFNRFVRSKLWRGLLRLGGSRLRDVIQNFSSTRLRSIFAFDPILERELSLRLLTQAVVPWTASIDREPVQLYAPASLLRTSLTANDDSAWRRRCPSIEIFEIAGQHQTLLQSNSIGVLREAFLTASRSWR